MQEIYYNIKIYTCILVISAFFTNLGVVEDFFNVFILLSFFFHFFSKWKLKKIPDKKEEKNYIFFILFLGLLFSYFIKKETILSIPKEFIGILIAQLVYITLMKIIEKSNKIKGNETS